MMRYAPMIALPAAGVALGTQLPQLSPEHQAMAMAGAIFVGGLAAGGTMRMKVVSELTALGIGAAPGAMVVGMYAAAAGGPIDTARAKVMSVVQPTVSTPPFVETGSQTPPTVTTTPTESSTSSPTTPTAEEVKAELEE